MTHDVYLPVMPMNSQPFQIQIFLKLAGAEEVFVTMRREKMCRCEAVQTQIGINQFKKIYHCPHRVLLTLSPENFAVHLEQHTELTMRLTFGNNGDTCLRYEILTSNKCILYLNFHIQIIFFDLTKCILTKALSPVRMDDFDCMVQPVWIHNPFAESLNFEFDSLTSNLQVLTHRVYVERGTIAPLFIKFRPTSPEGTITLKIPNFMSNLNTFSLTCSGVDDKNIGIKSSCPKSDGESDFVPFMLSESIVSLQMRRYSEEWRYVEVINNSDFCAEFRWLPYNSPPNYAMYSVNSFVEITVYPEIVIVPPLSRVKCSIHFASQEHKCILKNIPLFCEIHRPLTDSMKVARLEVSEVESVDEIRYFECTRITSLFLTFDIVIEKFPKFPIFSKEGIQNLFTSTEMQTEQKKKICNQVESENLERKVEFELIGEEKLYPFRLDRSFNQEEFEKILWEYIFGNSFYNLMGPLKNDFYD